MWDDLVGRRGRPRGILLGLSGGFWFEGDASAFDSGAQLNADISFNGDGYQAMAAVNKGARYGGYDFTACCTPGHRSLGLGPKVQTSEGSTWWHPFGNAKAIR